MVTVEKLEQSIQAPKKWNKSEMVSSVLIETYKFILEPVNEFKRVFLIYQLL